jgi:hypothetical protein
MERSRFEDYIARFNAEDATTFDDYLVDDMQMLNGGLRFQGIDGMKHHYQSLIWPHFKEHLTPKRFVSNDQHVAVEMWTNFCARDDADTLFGSVVKGEVFEYRGIIMYDLRGEKFATITVAYNSFRNTKPCGTTRDLGLPH